MRLVLARVPPIATLSLWDAQCSVWAIDPFWWLMTIRWHNALHLKKLRLHKPMCSRCEPQQIVKPRFHGKVTTTSYRAIFIFFIHFHLTFGKNHFVCFDRRKLLHFHGVSTNFDFDFINISFKQFSSTNSLGATSSHPNVGSADARTRRTKTCPALEVEAAAARQDLEAFFWGQEEVKLMAMAMNIFSDRKMIICWKNILKYLKYWTLKDDDGGWWFFGDVLEMFLFGANFFLG